jgi:phytanoyl-CoA hydroxylase
MLTWTDIEGFHANGFLIIRGLFHGEELAALQQAAAAVVDDGIANRGDGHLTCEAPDGQPVYWRSEQVWQRNVVFRAATVNPRLLAAVGQCIGQPFFPWNDSLVVKLPRRGTQVLWHQDPPYGWSAPGRSPRKTTGATPNFTTDIYLDRSDRSNGCVWAIPGRHLVGHVAWPGLGQEDLFRHPDAVPLELDAGDVLFHSLSTPHGSQANRSERIRRTFYIHYINEEARQDAYGGEDYAWARSKPVWGGERQAFLAQATAERRALCFATDGCGVGVGGNGITIAGLPMTPPRHWQRLAEALAPERRAELALLTIS